MSRLFSASISALTAVVAAGLLAAAFASCSDMAPTGTAPASGPAANSIFVAHEKGSAQLWQETCSRCHNVRSPSAYSAEQWQVVLHDMRIRGNLTGQEQRQILEFLQSSSH
jgi:hypothetical protein